MTIYELVTRALTLAGVVGFNRAPSSEEMQDGIDALNEMMWAWALDGLDLGWQQAVQTDDLLVDDAYVRGIRYNLAVELAGAHGILAELPQNIPLTAETEKANIRAALFEIDNLRADNALLGRKSWFDFTRG